MKRNRFLSFFLAGLMLFSFLSVFPNDSFSPFTMMEANAAEGRLYNQNDSYWKTVTFTKYATSGNDMYTSGCGIFSFCNAIYALNGSKIDAKSLATWAVDNGSYQPGNGGLYRQAFYNKIQAGYGSSYGFKIDGQYYGTISDTRLINHLKNGGVAAIHVSNHFMAVTGYNASNGTYHVIESAVYSGRGLQADSWVSASKLSSGATDVDWYALISSTGTLPTAPSLSINKRAGLATDTITISWDSVQGADSYWLHIYKDGEDYVNQTLNQALSYSAKYPVGNYVAYVVSCNGAGETLSKVEFTIYNGVPGTPNPQISKSLFAANEFVDITWSATQNTDSYWLHIYKNGEDYVNQTLGQDLSYSATYPAGEYVAYIVACNGLAETLSSVKFTVYDSAPAKPNPQISKTVFSTSEKVSIVWEEAKNTEYYWLHIYKDEADYVNENIYKSLSYSSTYPAGNYVAYIVSGNTYGETISSVSFQVIGNLKATLNANGGTCSTESVTVAYGGTYSSLPKPSRSGYTFDGWYTAASGGTKITETTNVTATTNHTLYAHWTENKYTITFNTNGGTCDTTSKSVTYNSTYGDLPTPTRTGHVFKGWFTAESGGTQITKDSKVTITANQTLYAQWTLNSYTVTLDANGGTVSDDSVTVTYSKGYGTLPKPTRDGYTFLGWFTAADGGTEVTASTTVTINKNHTLYAHWQKNKVVGDVNADGTFNVADVVMLQKWLICTPNATLTDWQAADMCDDDIIDVFDLCLMKRELISKS